MTPGHEVSDAIPGRRAVLEALRARRPLRKILIGRTTHGGTIRDILEEARRQDIVVQFVDGRRLDSLTHAARHQGVVALGSARPLVSVEDVLAVARTRRQPPFVLVLDGVEDPANLGGIIRTAEGAGVHGVIIPKHRAAGLTPAVAKISAGALEYLPVAQVTNLVRTLDELKEAGLWGAGADPTARDVYHRTRLLPPLAPVMCGEGKGLGRLGCRDWDIFGRRSQRGRSESRHRAQAGRELVCEGGRRMETGASQ